MTRPLLFALALTALLNGRALAAKPAPDQVQACRVAHSPRSHIGKTITFRAEYLTDHIERRWLRPIGCDRGFGLGSMTPVVEHLIADADPPIWYPGRRKIIAVFEAKVAQGKPNEFEFAHDDGVRLNVAKVAELQVIDAGPPPWAQRPPVR